MPARVPLACLPVLDYVYVYIIPRNFARHVYVAYVIVTYIIRHLYATSI